MTTSRRTSDSQFRVVGCDRRTTDARDNTATTYTSSDKGVPIYWLDGNKVADEYEDFYDGSWDDESNSQGQKRVGYQQHRYQSTLNNRPFTGCDHNGTERILTTGSVPQSTSPRQDPSCSVGRLNSGASPEASTGPSTATSDRRTKNDTRPMYGIYPPSSPSWTSSPRSTTGVSKHQRQLGVGHEFRLTHSIRPAKLQRQGKQHLGGYNTLIRGR